MRAIDVRAQVTDEGFLSTDFQHVECGVELDPRDHGSTPLTPALDHVAAYPGRGWLEFSAATDGDGSSDFLGLNGVYVGGSFQLLVRYVP